MFVLLSIPYHLPLLCCPVIYAVPSTIFMCCSHTVSSIFFMMACYPYRTIYHIVLCYLYRTTYHFLMMACYPYRTISCRVIYTVPHTISHDVMLSIPYHLPCFIMSCYPYRTTCHFSLCHIIHTVPSTIIMWCIQWENHVIEALQSLTCVPRHYFFGMHGSKEVLVMELLSGEDMSALR